MTPDPSRGPVRTALALCGALLTMAAGALLVVGAFLGLYVRPTSDDWCAAWKARDMGVFGITSDFYMTQNGRVTNALLSGIIYSDGLLGPKVLPAVIVLALGAGLVLLTREVLRLLGWQVPLAVLVAVALVLEALLFFAGTRAYQVLLWAPATISHTIPSVLGIWAVLFGIWTARSPRPAVRRTGLALAFVTAVAIGMLSEPFTLVSGLITGVAGLLALPRLRLAKGWYPFAWCATWCFGLVVGLAVLYTSPGARWRRAQQVKKDSMLSPHELKATVRDWLHMLDTIAGQWAYLGAAAAGLLLGLAVALCSPAGREAVKSPSRVLTVTLMLLPVPLVLAGSLLVAWGLRSGYGPTGWTYGRTWTNFMTPLLLTLALYGAWLGRWLGIRLSSGTAVRGAVPAVAVALAGALVLATVAALVSPVKALTTATVTRGNAWDAQDARIRTQIEKGATDVGYRPLYIGSLAEPFWTRNYSRDWAAQCTADYYGVERVHRQ